MAIRTLSVCSGIGGLDLGLRLADHRIRTVCYVEREAYAAATLVARMEVSALDQAPIWDDFTTLPGEWFCGRLDLVVGGIPCQPYSAAGRGLGAKDPRDLWGTMCRFLRESGRPALFLENVGAFVSRGLPRVLGDLADLGYHAAWGVFSCAQLGAPHVRKRLFLLAYNDEFLVRLKQGRIRWEDRKGASKPGLSGAELGHPDGQPKGEEGSGRHYAFRPDSERKKGHDRPELSVEKLGHAESTRELWRRGSTEGRFGNSKPSLGGQAFSDADQQEELGHPSRQLPHGSGIEGDQREAQEPRLIGDLPLWPPGQDPDAWRDWPEHYWPSAQRPVRGAVDGFPAWMVESVTYRTDRLRCLGNAVSPPVAAVAWRVLIERVTRGGGR